ncbi:MAG: LamG domain-containing protein [bacterium]|nr:LamG domain-containing protein [bacterium]
MATLKSIKNKYLQASDGDVLGVTTNTENISSLSFKLATADSISKFNLVDGFSDDYQDATGVDASGSTNESRDSSGKYYSGTVVVAGGQTAFTTVETTSWTAPAGLSSATYLVVGGGGGAGSGRQGDYGGGGGGAGGLRTGSLPVSGGSSYTVTVGAGGSGGPGGSVGAGSPGTSGGNSTFATITSAGGGKGSYNNQQQMGAGGSGGGNDGGGAGSPAAGNTPSTSPSQGNPGGNGSHYQGGGGGGSGGSGSNGAPPASNGTGGNGGAGTDLSGTFGTGVGESGWFAGGGGGGHRGDGTGGYGNGGNGSLGGGGNAYLPSSAAGAGENAQDGTGGGGGGGSVRRQTDGGDGAGGDGGNGVVIVKWDAINLYHNMTLKSNAFTAQAVPTTARIVLDELSSGGGTTLNTDLKAYASRDNGTTYTQMTLADQGYLNPNSGIDGYTKLMLHCDGSNDGTTFTDSSFSGHTVTASGNGVTSTTTQKFGTASYKAPATGDFLSIADSDDWNFGSGDFTIDCWLYRTGASSYQTILENKTDNSNYWQWRYFGGSGNFDFTVTGAGAFSVNWTVSAFAQDTWVHHQLVRNGNSWYMFQNGTQVGGTQTQAAAVPDMTGNLILQGDSSLGQPFVGYMDEFRISKGIARNTSNFVVPSGEYVQSRRLLSGSVDISGQPSGTSVKYKIETLNQASTKQTRLYGTSMAWA